MSKQEFNADEMRVLISNASTVLKWFGHEMEEQCWDPINTVQVSKYYTFYSSPCLHQDCCSIFKIGIMFGRRNPESKNWMLTDKFFQCDGIHLIDVSANAKLEVMSRHDIRSMYCGRIATLL